jgi:hypothetical protein
MAVLKPDLTGLFLFLLQSAQREIALWFKPEELAMFTRIIDEWVYEGQ